MSLIIPGESIWYNKWDSTEEVFVEYNAICRVSPLTDHGDCNLSWFDEDGKESQHNNVKNIEDETRDTTEAYWRRRYSNQDLSWLTGHLETTRVEKGDMILYRKWDTETHWQGGYFAVVVTTVGAPSDPHPKVNLKYVNESGTTITIPDMECIEKFADEDEAEGNDLWSNLPTIELQSI